MSRRPSWRKKGGRSRPVRKDRKPLKLVGRVLAAVFVFLILAAGWIVWTYRGPGPAARHGPATTVILARGSGVVVVDPKGDLAADSLDRVPAERIGDVVVFDPSDEERPVGLNPLAGAQEDPELVVDQVVGIAPKPPGPRIDRPGLHADRPADDSPRHHQSAERLVAPQHAQWLYRDVARARHADRHWRRRMLQ